MIWNTGINHMQLICVDFFFDLRFVYDNTICIFSPYGERIKY